MIYVYFNLCNVKIRGIYDELRHLHCNLKDDTL